MAWTTATKDFKKNDMHPDNLVKLAILNDKSASNTALSSMRNKQGN